ncbi:thiopurine S-methyltransferase, partial [Elysia marginata]
VLRKHFDKLNPDGKSQKVLVTMCGMAVDMTWLADKGMEVIGVDIALPALTKFIAQSGQDWTETTAPKLGPDAKLFTRNDGNIKLYWGDVLEFTEELEGTFDSIFDVAGIQVLDSINARLFAKKIKSLLNPGGRLLLEAGIYDTKLLDSDNFNPPLPVPPPYSVTPKDVQELFEPECSVELIDQIHFDTYFYGHEKINYNYIITKKQEQPGHSKVKVES